MLALGAAAAPRIALVQTRPVRIGVLAPRQRPIFLPPFLKRLGELGYVEGKNLTVEFRSADGVVERFPSLARELIQAKCDLFIALGTEHPARALLEAKAGIPVVIVAITYDPVKAGVVSNLRQPGGIVTGVSLSAPAAAAKRLEILREIVPNAKRLLVLVDSQSEPQLEAVREAAKKLRVEIVVETLAALPYDFESAFAKGRAAGIEAVSVLDSPVFLDQRTKIAELAIKHRLVSVSAHVFFAEAGLLISYGANLAKIFARAGDIAASILKGAKPGDIPVEQPTDFEFVVNMKTAKALGISILPSILFRADRLIQ
jgi:putative ABC transport system substrate-binding protein